MTAKRIPWDTQILQNAVSSPDDLIFGPVETGRLYSIQWIAVEDETTALTSLRIAKLIGNREHWLLEEMAPQATRLYWNNDPVYLKADQSLLVRFVGATAADLLRVYLSGWFIHVSGHD